MSVSFNLFGLISLPIIFFLLLKWPKSKIEIIDSSRVGIFRRTSAFYIDVFVATIGVLPIICMPILILEYYETGQWEWSFYREFFRPSDVLGILFFLIGFFGIFYYFKWHFTRNKQTLGQYFLKFMLVPIEDPSSMSIRILVAWATFAWWPIWPWTIMKKQQDYWWDRSSRIKARRVKTI